MATTISPNILAYVCGPAPAVSSASNFITPMSSLAAPAVDVLSNTSEGASASELVFDINTAGLALVEETTERLLPSNLRLLSAVIALVPLPLKI